MKSTKRIVIILLLPLLASCSDIQKASNLSYASFDEINLERTGCYGSCPIYAVTIHNDGSVIFQGKGNVKIEGERRSKVSLEDIHFLLNAFEKITFLSLKDSYTSEMDGCKEVWTDTASQIISLRSNKHIKTVSYYNGCMGLSDPEKISWLADTIDILVGTRQWVGFPYLEARFKNNGEFPFDAHG